MLIKFWGFDLTLNPNPTLWLISFLECILKDHFSLSHADLSRFQISMLVTIPHTEVCRQMFVNYAMLMPTRPFSLILSYGLHASFINLLVHKQKNIHAFLLKTTNLSIFSLIGKANPCLPSLRGKENPCSPSQRGKENPCLPSLRGRAWVCFPLQQGKAWFFFYQETFYHFT